MSDTSTTAKDDWVKLTLGMDMGGGAQGGKQAGAQGAPPGGAKAPAQRRGSMFGDIAKGLGKLGGDIVSGVESVGKGIVSGVEAVGEGIVSGVEKIGEAVVAGVEAVGEAINEKTMEIATGDYEASLKRLDAEIKNVKDAGLEATPYEAQAKNIREQHKEGLAGPDIITRYKAVKACTERAKAAADQAVADVARLKKSAVEGITGAITKMRDGAKKQIDKVDAKDPKKAELDKKLSELDKSITEAGKLTDRAERAKQLKVINKTAQSLFDEAVGVTKDKSEVEKIYGEALKERYGINITNPDKMPNTHLDQVYKMFDKVPEADVVQGQMQTLNYEPTSMEDDGHGKMVPVKNTGASYGGAQINMGDYGNEDWEYVDPDDPSGKTKVPANGFSISTLHELGHSVDDRFKIMDSNQGKAGGGGWRSESVDSTAKAFIGEFKAGAGKGLSKPLDESALSKAINEALAAKVNRPGGMTDPDWAILKTTLDICAGRLNDQWPWGNDKFHAIGGRAYHESYGGEWWSYDTAVRGKALTVRDYQWRAPGEFFAELYAFSFFNEKKPPTPVDSSLAAYMFGGASAV